MLLFDLINNPQKFIAYVTAILVAISVHEFAHALAAYKLGDPTAKNAGRLTLNPLAHLDFLGTIFLLLVGFGWGKPVPINNDFLKNEKFDEIKISLAGPFSNFILAIILGIIIRFIPFSANTIEFLSIIITINLVLMTFNLFPVPPLDGSHILQVFLPKKTFIIYQQLGIYILLGLLIISSYIPIIYIIIEKVISVFFKLIVGSPIQL